MSDQMVRRPEVRGLSHNWQQMSYASGLPAQRKVMQVRAWCRAPGYGDLVREGSSRNWTSQETLPALEPEDLGEKQQNV